MSARGPRGMFGVRGSGDVSGYGRLAPPKPRHDNATRPFDGSFEDVAVALDRVLGGHWDDAVERSVIHRGELTLHIARTHLTSVASALRDDADLRYELCLGVSGVHRPDDAGRELRAVYHLQSITHGRRLRLEVSVPESDPHIPSLCGIYPTTDWHERESYDFFGIEFDGHPSLTRIQMPDDWTGHPQRKDYPLGGIPVEFKGAQIPPPDQRRSYN